MSEIVRRAFCLVRWRAGAAGRRGTEPPQGGANCTQATKESHPRRRETAGSQRRTVGNRRREPRPRRNAAGHRLADADRRNRVLDGAHGDRAVPGRADRRDRGNLTGARHGRAHVVVAVRIQPARHGPGGGLEGLAARGVLKGLEILFVGRSGAYERFDFGVALDVERSGELLFTAPFFTASAVCSWPAASRASHSALLTSTNAFANCRKRRHSAICIRVSASARGGIRRVTVLPLCVRVSDRTGPCPGSTGLAQ